MEMRTNCTVQPRRILRDTEWLSFNNGRTIICLSVYSIYRFQVNSNNFIMHTYSKSFTINGLRNETLVSYALAPKFLLAKS